MRNPKSEEERIERLIRSLLKLPENRRCVNCNLLGPQYVCTTFSTFICTNCSGIHREFTHRVKSVSMAKFTPEEVTALQSVGNERAKQMYFKEWDPLRHSYPDSCNIPKLREFIKRVYVERRFTGESCSSSLPRIKMHEKEESHASKKSSSFRLELMSPRSSPGPRSEDKNVRYLYDESRSPKYAQKYKRHGSIARNPIKFEVVDDRFRDDDHRKSRFSNIESKLKQISIDGHKSVEKSQLPITRPLGDKFRENAPSLQVTHSREEGPIEENSSEQKKNNPESSIDMSTKSQSSHAAAGVGPETPSITQTNDENNWAVFDTLTGNNDSQTQNTNASKPSTTEAASSATSAKNPLDLLLFELLDPVTAVTGGLSQAPSGTNSDPTTTKEENANTWDFLPTSMGHKTALPNNTSALSFPSTPANELAQPSNEIPPHTEVSHAHKPSSSQNLPSASASCSSTTQQAWDFPPVSTGNTTALPNNTRTWSFPSTPATELAQPSNELPPHTEVSHAHKPSSLQHPPLALASCSSTTQPTNSAVKDVALNNQPSVAPNTNDSSRAFTDLSSQNTSKPTQETRPDLGSQPSKLETKSSGRMELPEDLFSSSYLSGSASFAGSWQNAQSQGMGYGMQYYHNAVPPSAPSNPPKSSNPFDVTDGRSLMHVSSLPTMASLHGALPAVSPRTGLIYASSHGSLGSMMSQSPCYTPPVPMGVYFDQVNDKEQHTRPQRAESFNEITAFGSLDPIQQSGGGNMILQTSNSLSQTRGNPFD